MFPLVPLGSLTTLVQYGTSERSVSEKVGIPVLRIPNLQADGWELSDLKYLELPPAELATYRLERGDILFNRTNGSRELVGKCEVFDFEGDWAFASYLIRLRIEEKRASPQFVAAFLNTFWGRRQVEHVSRQILMSNINTEEIRALRVPLPGLPKQRELMSALEKARSERNRKRAEADALLAGLDGYLLDQLGVRMPPTGVAERQCFAVRLGETRSERRIDPHRFAPRTRKLRQMIGRSRFQTQVLSQLILEPVSGDWGIDETEREDDREYVRCLVIRATEFDNTENLILDNDRVKYRLIEQASYDYRSLRPGDIVLEKSGGGPLQPVGRVALIEAEHIQDKTICFSNFILRLRPCGSVRSTYLWAFLGMVNRCGLTESMQAQTHGIRNLKLEEYLSQPVPMPPADVQEAISAEVARRRIDARRLREEARIGWEDARRLFEEALLGPAPAPTGTILGGR
jgi:hypothetical protein